MLGVILLVTLLSVLNASPVERKTPPPEYKPMANDEIPQKPDNVRPSRPAWVSHSSDSYLFLVGGDFTPQGYMVL